MLLVHQAGSLRVGEVVRYKLTYSPAADPILPTPPELHVKVKNTSAIPLRAAYLHGPYALYTACYPADFDPNSKNSCEGSPQFEPNLKPGGSWDATITVPQEAHFISPNTRSHQYKHNVTWVIEIVSQVIFSTTAVVHFELLVSRDRTALDLGHIGRVSKPESEPAPSPVHHGGRLKGQGQKSPSSLVTMGVFPKSVTLSVEDTSSLWSTPSFPSWEKKNNRAQDTQSSKHLKYLAKSENYGVPEDIPVKTKYRKRVHFVVLTHGLHSNLGADMLYLKESIDAAVKRARQQKMGSGNDISLNAGFSPPPAPHENNSPNGDPDADDEEVIVRGFPGNVVRTERGIQYLGKRLAKYVLLMTYPDQPYLPINHRASSSRSRLHVKRSPEDGSDGFPDRCNHRQNNTSYPYKITSISFIGHSLGGLVQTYAIAYIQKHSPEFFNLIKPINFIALATPFLGLSNENPIYVRFALDLGLVGKTGQDLGLSWTAPNIRSGWGVIMGGKSEKGQRQSNAESKPLLRILPVGPANQALLKFRNRTIYSNVVNDGIVPLRTSCLLFLDWKGLERVQKARRENGLVGTMAEWGWAELTGANSSPSRPNHSVMWTSHSDNRNEAGSDSNRDPWQSEMSTDQNNAGRRLYDVSAYPTTAHYPTQHSQRDPPYVTSTNPQFSSELAPLSETPGPLSLFFSMLRPKGPRSFFKRRQGKIYRLSQTIDFSDNSEGASSAPIPETHSGHVRDHPLSEDEDLITPPRTTVFESAGDLLRPPLPPTEFIMDPDSRPRTIFHDRIYHPEDIPPPLEDQHTVPISPRDLPFNLAPQELSKTDGQHDENSVATESSRRAITVEEKIARAYHHDLSWRKVLVRLEPDAHNNIIVRRMFANAYGWPVIKHLVETHFRCDQAQRDDFRTRRVSAMTITSPEKMVMEDLSSHRYSPFQLPENHASRPPDYVLGISNDGGNVHRSHSSSASSDADYEAYPTPFSLGSNQKNQSSQEKSR